MAAFDLPSLGQGQSLFTVQQELGNLSKLSGIFSGSQIGTPVSRVHCLMCSSAVVGSNKLVSCLPPPPNPQLGLVLWPEKWIATVDTNNDALSWASTCVEIRPFKGVWHRPRSLAKVT